jgi:divalent metal cation (Fe/Co/Zn/Cd) transporter
MSCGSQLTAPLTAMKVARERKSSVLASNAVHHRVDSLTGIVTLAVILAANFVKNAEWLDPVGGLLISLLVIKAGFQNTASALQELADRTIDDEVKKSVRKQVHRKLEATSRAQDVELRDVSGVKSGQNYLIDLEMAVPHSWTVEELGEIEDGVRFQVGSKVRGAKRVRVRFVPRDGQDRKIFDEFIPGDVTPRSSPEPEDDEHDQSHDNGHNHKHQ